MIALLLSKPNLVARLQPAEPPPPGRQLGFAGVGKPWKVQRSLKAAGCELVDFVAFPDHAPYHDDALKALAIRAEGMNAGLVTTEKDWVRLPKEWRRRVKAWPVTAAFEDGGAVDALLAGISARPELP